MTSSVHTPSVRAGLGGDDHLHRVLLLLPDIKVTETLEWLTSNISFLCHCAVRSPCGGGGAGDTGAEEDEAGSFSSAGKASSNISTGHLSCLAGVLNLLIFWAS